VVITVGRAPRFIHVGQAEVDRHPKAELIGERQGGAIRPAGSGAGEGGKRLSVESLLFEHIRFLFGDRAAKPLELEPEALAAKRSKTVAKLEGARVGIAIDAERAPDRAEP